MEPYDIRPAIISQGMKTFMTFIDRVGFPIVVALLMWYLNVQLTKTIESLNITLTKQTVVLQAISDRLGIRVVHDAAPEQRP
jgi:hypothetical protein